VRNCCLDEQEVCLGCGRALPEILRWQGATAEERDTIRENAKQRLAAIQARRRW
jgi:predicted Fe-S protein YdhL (DUF1289 family)